MDMERSYDSMNQIQQQKSMQVNEQSKTSNITILGSAHKPRRVIKKTSSPFQLNGSNQSQ